MDPSLRWDCVVVERHPCRTGLVFRVNIPSPMDTGINSTLPDTASLADLRESLIARGCERILLISGESSRFNALVLPALEGFAVTPFTGARVHVPREEVDAALAALDAHGADTVISLGGGSATGLGKALRLERDIRFIAIPTTYAGSEYTDIYGITEAGEKRNGRDPRVRPDLVIREPALYEGIPKDLSTASLLNALAHPLSLLAGGSLSEEDTDEALVVTGRLARVMEWLAKSPDSVAARQESLDAAARAASLMGRGEYGVQHRLAHFLGGHFELPHAPLHATLLPHFIQYFQSDNPELFNQIVNHTGWSDPAAELFDLLRRGGAPLSLQQLGVGPADLERALVERPELNLPWLCNALLGRRPSLALHRFDAGMRDPAVRLGPAVADAERVVVTLHGRRSNAERALELARHVVGSDPGTTLIAPQAEDNEWLSERYFASLDTHGEALERALTDIARLVDALLAETTPERLILFGFSQGGCLAIELVARGLVKPTMLLAPGAARMGLESEWPRVGVDLSGVRVFLGVSEHDPWIRRGDVCASRAWFESAGAGVERLDDPGDLHAISMQQRWRMRRMALGSALAAAPTGYGNAVSLEALPGALPAIQNSPRHAPYGLSAEQVNGSAFTTRRGENLRSWLYRIRPGPQHGSLRPIQHANFGAAAPRDLAEPNLSGFRAPAAPDLPMDFIDGLVTLGGAGDVDQRRGYAVHAYSADRSMENRAFSNADGDLLLVPVQGELLIMTECGALTAGPGRVALLPRGIRFSVCLADWSPGRHVSGYLAEVYGRHFTLPERGPVGANGLADARHFRGPAPWYEDRFAPGYRVTLKSGDRLFEATQDFSPHDVVAWHGNYLPWSYDLSLFSPVGNVRFDHPDPSIHTVLSAPLDEAGVNALDFVIFAPRWDPTEHTFRPPYFHRNATTEINGIIHNPAPADSPFQPGCLFVTPAMTPHGVRASGVEGFLALDDAEANRPAPPDEDALWCQFETALPFHPARHAAATALRIDDWPHTWGSYRSSFRESP